MKSSLSDASTHRSTLFMPAYFLKRTALPSILGLIAIGPIFPRPGTAVPLEMHATILPLLVYLYARDGSLAICRHGDATPGEYANDKSCAVDMGLVGTISNFPGFGLE